MKNLGRECSLDYVPSPLGCIVYGDRLGVVGSVSLDYVPNSVGVIHVNRLGVVSYGTRLT